MKKSGLSKKSNFSHKSGLPPVMTSRGGFTLIELLVGSTVMLVLIFGALALYMQSNKISVDQQQLSELQHDVRSSMFFIARDIRSAGVGLTLGIAGHFLQGKDGFGPGPEASDSIKVMGNFDKPLNLRIRDYQGGGGGAAATAFLYNEELENAPYICPDDYEDRQVLIISTTQPGCFAVRFISAQGGIHGCGEGAAHFNMQPGQSGLNPPGGLVEEGCEADDYDEAILTFVQIKQYWLDTTGNPGDYPDEDDDYSDFTLVVGQDGYLGIPNTLYLTAIAEDGSVMHMPLAQNIENLQFQYNLVDADGNFEGFTNWNDNWTADDRLRIRQVRIWVLGRTPDPFVSVSLPVQDDPDIPLQNPFDLHLYRRPAVANSPQANDDDRHRRFLLESTANIRNLSLNIYNTGTR